MQKFLLQRRFCRECTEQVRHVWKAGEYVWTAPEGAIKSKGMWCSPSVQKNSWRCHNALKFTWELGCMILDLWIQAQEEPWSSSGKGYQDYIQNKTSLTNISYGESLLSQDYSTEDFMGLDLPLKSMKSLSNANQALKIIHSPMLSRWHSQQNTLRSLEGGAVSVPEWGCGWGAVREASV